MEHIAHMMGGRIMDQLREHCSRLPITLEVIVLIVGSVRAWLDLQFLVIVKARTPEVQGSSRLAASQEQ